MEKEKITKIASIIVGLILALVLIFFGFRIIQNRAGRAEVSPNDVKVIDTTQNGFTVTFNARTGLEAKVDYDTECKENANLFATCTAGKALDNGDVQYSCPITLASPDSTYYFTVDVAGKTVDNAGTCFQAKTLGKATSQPTSETILTPRPTLRPVVPTLPQASNPEFKIEEIKAKFNTGDYTLVQCVSEFSNSEYNASFACIKAAASLTPTPTPTP